LSACKRILKAEALGESSKFSPELFAWYKNKAKTEHSQAG
jgi:hypothetical protein